MDFDIVINTDGACVGNPGIMGIGGVIVKLPENETIKTFSIKMRKGTSNEAEYFAVIEALKILSTLDIKFNNVLLLSDSQNTVHHLNDIFQSKVSHLVKLYKETKKLMKSIDANITIEWVSRDNNHIADALASAACGMPQALIRGDQVFKWEMDGDFIPDAEKINSLPPLNDECKVQVDFLKSLGDKAKFRDFLPLKSGTDKYSHYKEEKLSDCIAIRFGVSAVNFLNEVLTEAEDDYKRQALRWTARGLEPNLALKKVSVDLEDKHNKKNKSRR
jgi:ribonuclease HI